MKIKMKHNKKRNTAFLYEALVRRITKCVLEEQKREKVELFSIVKNFFSKGSPLAEELSLYQAVLDAKEHNSIFVEKIISESKFRFVALNRKKIFSEQSKLISLINKKYGKDFYDSHVPNYRHLATMFSIFNNSIPVKSKVLLERSLVNELANAPKKEPPHELMGSTVLLREILNGFNAKYTTLFEEQKCLLNAFILSLSDDGLSLKAFLNEELFRLKKIVTDSLELEEVRADSVMKENTERVLQLFEEFKKKPIDTNMLEQVLKIQKLAREVQG